MYCKGGISVKEALIVSKMEVMKSIIDTFILQVIRLHLYSFISNFFTFHYYIFYKCISENMTLLSNSILIYKLH